MPTMNDANGTPQRVADNGYALGYGASMSMEAHAGDGGNTYTMIVNADPGNTDIDFAYMKNTSDKTLRIYKIKVFCTADVEISILAGPTNPTNTTAITPVNALIGSGNAAEGDFYYRAGDLDLAGGDQIDTIIIDASVNPTAKAHYTGEIALEKNQTVGFNAVSDPNAAIRMTIYFYYHEKVE